jgi:hypothetical protein
VNTYIDPTRVYRVYFRPAPGGTVLNVRTRSVTAMGAKLAALPELMRAHGGKVQLVDIREEAQT